MATVEVETGRYVKRFEFWNPSTWAIPALYWDTFSQEQRIHAICRQLGKVVAYADYVGVNVDDIAARLKAIEDGELDEYIVAAIEEWFDDNQPAIMSAISQLETDVDALEVRLPKSAFTSTNTVKKYIDDAISTEQTARQNADGTLTTGLTNEQTARQNADNALRADINTLNTQVLKDYAVFIGDSYLRGTGSAEGPTGGEGYDSIGNGWGKFLITRLNLTADKVMCIAGGGGGFVSLGVNGGGNGRNFSGMIEHASELMTADERSRVGLIVICGGVNDGSDLTYASVTNAIETARTEFPKVPIHVFTNIGTNSYRRGLATGQAHAYNIMKQACAVSGASYHEIWPLMLNATDTYVADDTVHLTTPGYRVYGRAMQAMIAGGELGCPFMPSAGFINIEPEENVTFSYPILYDGKRHVQMQGVVTLSTSYNGSGATNYIGMLPSMLVPNNTIYIPALIIYSYDDGATPPVEHTAASLCVVEIIGSIPSSNNGRIRFRKPLGLSPYTGSNATSLNMNVIKGGTIYLPSTEWDIF